MLTTAVAASALAAVVAREFWTPRRALAITVGLVAASAFLSGGVRAWLGAACVLVTGGALGLLLGRVAGWLRPPTLILLSLGLAALSQLAWVASLAGAFSPAFVWAVGAAACALAVGLRARGLLGSPSEGPPPATERALVGGLAALLAVLAPAAALPEFAIDAVWIHLPQAREIAEGRYIVVPEVWWTMIPHGYHMLAAVAHAAGGVAAAKALHYLFLLLSAGWALWLGERLYGRAAGLVAAALLLTIPLVMWNGTVGYTDLGVVVFALGAVAAFFEFLDRGGVGWLLVAGALVGTATAVKYHGAALLIPFGLILLIEAVRRRSAIGLLPQCLVLAAGAALAVGPWVVRTARLTGNPIFPLLNEYFESPYSVRSWEETAFSGFGFAWTVTSLLALPFTTTFAPSRFGDLPPGAMGTVPLLWLPVIAARRSVIGRHGWYLLIIAAGSFACVFAVAQYLRYTVVAWLLLAVVVGGAATGGSGALPTSRAGRAVLGVVLVAALAVSLAAWLAFYPVGPALDVLTGRIAEREFLERTVTGIAIYEQLPRFVPPDEKILVAGLHATLYAQRYLVPYRRQPFEKLLADPTLSRAEALTLVRRHGFRYLLVRPRAGYRLLNLGITRPLMHQDGVTLYELMDPEVGGPGGP